MAAVILVSLLPALLVSGADGKKPARTKKPEPTATPSPTPVPTPTPVPVPAIEAACDSLRKAIEAGNARPGGEPGREPGANAEGRARLEGAWDESRDYSFVFEGATLKYSPDEQEYWVYLTYTKVGGVWSLVLEREVDGSSTYTAMTTRGAITTVEKFLLTTYLLGFPDLKRPAHRGTPPPSFISRVGFGVPVEKARTITERGQTVRMVVTGRIAGGTIEEDDAKKATLSSPTEYLNRQKVLPVRPGQVTLRLAETNETLATLGGSAVLEPRED